MLSVLTRDELAADLAEAERSRVSIGPLTDRNPTIDVVDAYEIQLITSASGLPKAPAWLATRWGCRAKRCSR